MTADQTHPETGSSDVQPSRRRLLPRMLLLISVGVIALVLLRSLTGFSSRDERRDSQALFARHDLILVATQGTPFSDVDLHVVVDGEELTAENRALRGVILDAILPVLPGIGDGLASFGFSEIVFEELALPVRDGFLVHVRTSSSAEVWFVGAGGQDNAIQLFSSNRDLYVSYAPRADVLLIREDSEDDFRCYRGSASDPVERVGRGDGCWLGVDGAIAIARRGADALTVTYLASGSNEPNERVLRNVVAAPGSLNARDIVELSDGRRDTELGGLAVMGLWGSRGEFSYLEAVDESFSIVRVSLLSGDEVYRSPTWTAEDEPLVVLDPLGPRVVGNLEEELPEVRLTSEVAGTTEVTRAQTAIVAHPLSDGRIIYSAIESRSDTLVDVAIWNGTGGSPSSTTLVEQVKNWFPLESSVISDADSTVESLLALREDGEVLLVDASGSTSPRSLGITDATVLFFAAALKGDGGRLTVFTESDRGFNIDIWDGDQTLRLIDGWADLSDLIPTAEGYLVVGTEVAGDSAGVFLIQPGVASITRLFRASEMEVRGTSDPDVFYINAVDADDAGVTTLHRLDLSDRTTSILGRGRFVVRTAYDIDLGPDVSASRQPVAREVMLFDECKDSFIGRLEPVARVEIPLDGGSTACWLWERVPGDDEDAFVWLHSNEFAGSIEVSTFTGFSLASYSTAAQPRSPLRRPELPAAIETTPLFVLVRSAWDPGTVHTAILESTTGIQGQSDASLTILVGLHDDDCDPIFSTYAERAQCLAEAVAIVNDAGVDDRSLRHRTAEQTIFYLTTALFAPQAADYRIDRLTFEYCQPDPRRIDRHLCYFAGDSGDPNRRPVIMLSARVDGLKEFYAAEFFYVDSRGFRR